MRNSTRKIGEIALAAAMAAGTMPARATSCWHVKEVNAARVREMQTVLMVAALRCHAAGIDIASDYNGFVGAQRDALAAANLVIKQHFATGGGGQADYDRFATSLANGHGDDETTQATCGEATALARDGAAAADGALQQIAEARVFPIALPGGACDATTTTTTTTLAMAAPKAEAAAPIVMLAAMPAVAHGPVSLPGDVTAALTVLARYYSAPATPVATGKDATKIAAALP